MKYAIIDDGVIRSIYELTPLGALEVPDAVPIGDMNAGIGDTYADGAFWRDGVRLLTPLEQAEATIAALDSEVLELELANAMMALGL